MNLVDGFLVILLSRGGIGFYDPKALYIDE
jgi:hypothetical protein